MISIDISVIATVKGASRQSVSSSGSLPKSHLHLANQFFFPSTYSLRELIFAVAQKAIYEQRLLTEEVSGLDICA